MNVIRIAYPSGGDLSQMLLKLGVAGGSELEIGTASFAAGERSPPEGFHVRDAHEIAFILEGLFHTESGGETRILHAGDLVNIPAGEPNASRALVDCRVIYLMYHAEGVLE